MITQSLYKQILKNIPIACVDVAIVYDGSALLVKRSTPPAKDQWWVPGGRILKGETLKEAAQRKAFKEVGIECQVGPIIHTAETIFSDGPYGIPVHSINSCFFLYPCTKNFTVKLDKYHTDYKWVKKIPLDLHLNRYVENCLEGAGLEYK